MTGDATAKAAADAARGAQKANDTGLLVASSNREDQTEEPAEPAEPVEKKEPPAEKIAPPELRILMVKGTATMAGEPIKDVKQVIADALASDASTVVIIEAGDDTRYAAVVKVLDAVHAGGAKHIAMRPPAPAEPEGEVEPKVDDQIDVFKIE